MEEALKDLLETLYGKTENNKLENAIMSLCAASSTTIDIIEAKELAIYIMKLMIKNNVSVADLENNKMKC
jgi:hypothetical protein